jgi:hypothetical protein
MLPVGGTFVVVVVVIGSEATGLAGNITGAGAEGVMNVGMIGMLDGGASDGITGGTIGTWLGADGVCTTGGDGITVCRTC